MTTDNDVRQNLENAIEDIAALKLSREKDSLVLYGDSSIRLTGMLERVENLEAAMDNAIKNINGMPEKVNTLDTKFDEFIETDKKRVWLVRGIGIGLGVQLSVSTGLWDLVVKVFS